MSALLLKAFRTRSSYLIPSLVHSNICLGSRKKRRALSVEKAPPLVGLTISRILSRMIIYLTPLARRARSIRAADATITREKRAGGPTPCFVLHRMGFFVPRRLRAGRWALTPPFHPYPGLRRGGLFSVTLSVIRDFHRGRPHFLCGMLPCGVRTFLYPGMNRDSDHLSFRHECNTSPGMNANIFARAGRLSFPAGSGGRA